MEVRNHPIRTITAGLLMMLGAEACKSGPTQSGVNRVRTVAETADAVLTEGDCPEINTENISSRSTPKDEDLVALTYVVNPDEKDERGKLANLHAAQVKMTYFVKTEAGEEVAVYCGPYNQANGAPYEGVMLAPSNDSALIVKLRQAS